MTDPNQPDNPIDNEVARTLAALRSATPPAGMEDRILYRLDAHLTESHGAPFVRGPQDANGWGALHSAWLRGALTGAFAAIAACAALFFALHTSHSTAPQTIAAAPHAPAATPVALNPNATCAGPTDVRVPHSSSAWVGNGTTSALGAPFMRSHQDAHEWGERTSTRSPHLISASFAPSRPAPPAPLTAQERALIQLTRNASPTLLASLSSAAQQKSDAKRQADFDTFFAPSAAIRAIDEEQKKALGIPDDDVPAATNPTQEGSL
jgi:hypothetical protein